MKSYFYIDSKPNKELEKIINASQRHLKELYEMFTNSISCDSSIIMGTIIKFMQRLIEEVDDVQAQDFTDRVLIEIVKNKYSLIRISETERICFLTCEIKHKNFNILSA